MGNCDPTLGLTKSQSFVEDKDKKQKKSIFKSPFNIRKKTSVKKGGSWDLPQEGTNEPDSESIVSEVTHRERLKCALGYCNLIPV